MINVVVPMAGAGSRFSEVGYTIPKPFIDVAGLPMIEVVLENLAMPDVHFILIARTEHLQRYAHIFSRLSEHYSLTIRTSDSLTEGPASTVFLAADLINREDPLLIANSDQVTDIAMEDFISNSDARGLDGSILTFPSDDPKWSYAAIDEQGLVTAVKEKVAISPHATVGIYYWHAGTDFVAAAARMMAKNDRVNNEFYVCPAYAYLIDIGKKIGIFEIAPEQMHGLGTPNDLKEYLRLGADSKAIAAS